MKTPSKEEIPWNDFLPQLLPYEGIFEKIVRLALDKGVVFGSVPAIDATHVPANVNTFKDKMRQEKEGRRT